MKIENIKAINGYRLLELWFINNLFISNQHYIDRLPYGAVLCVVEWQRLQFGNPTSRLMMR